MNVCMVGYGMMGEWHSEALRTRLPCCTPWSVGGRMPPPCCQVAKHGLAAEDGFAFGIFNRYYDKLRKSLLRLR